jgi:muramoyltetrapeptide carboxypeptidase
MIPAKLKEGDEVRIISPARSLSIISKEVRKIAIQRFEELGFKVTFSKNVEEKDIFSSSSIKSRVADLHEAFSDKNVKAIFTTIGGFNSNQILKYLDYQLIKNNPKILCGYSDITALANAITAKTELVTYSGPHFSTLGMLRGLDYSLEYLKKSLIEEKPFTVKTSEKWSDDPWYSEQEKRKFINNEGFWLINEGKSEGTIFGGNLCTFQLLHGTEFMPKLNNAILFIEDDDLAGSYSDAEFDRDLQSLIHQSNFEKVVGIVIGRFQNKCEITKEKLTRIIKSKEELKNLPVIANADFGHTTPQITFPIGGTAKLLAKNKKVTLEIIKH